MKLLANIINCSQVCADKVPLLQHKCEVMAAATAAEPLNQANKSGWHPLPFACLLSIGAGLHRPFYVVAIVIKADKVHRNVPHNLQ